MKNLLNNPKTLDWDHVNRALQYRQIDNPADISLMLLFTVVVLLSLFGLSVYIIQEKKKWIYIVLSSVFMLYILSLIIVGFTQFLPNGLVLDFPEMTMLKLFYLCDGVIILLAYSYQVSYEAMNLILFFVIQPLIIVSLFWRAIRLQLKLNRYEQSTDIAERRI